MADKVFFSATKLPMLKKEGKITPDADGYYELVLGGLNTYNNSREYYYTIEGVRELFGPGSLLHRKIANGCCRAEVNHPKQQPNEPMERFVGRMLDIDRNNVCAHIKEIWLDENFGKNHPEYNNPDLVAIMGKVKPCLPKGDMLKESLDNPNENVCFSIRSVADEGYVRGRKTRVLKEVITFDYVNEGGVLVASKWDSPATESINDDVSLRMTRELLERVMEAPQSAMATESSKEVVSDLLTRYFPKKETSSIWSKW